MANIDAPVPPGWLILASAISLPLALAFPLGLAVVGFAAFGVAHNLAELRYVFGRYVLGRLSRSTWLLVALPLLAVIAVRAGGGRWFPAGTGKQIEFTLVYGTLLAVTSLHRGPLGLRAALIGLISLGAWASFTWPGLHFLVLSHLHNLMPALFIMLHCSMNRWRVGAATALWALLMPALILSGALDPLLNAAGLGPMVSLARPRALYGLWVPPGWTEIHAVRAVATFSFLQGMHYAIWIGILPRFSAAPTVSGRAWAWFYGPVATGLVIALTLALVPAYVNSYLDTFSIYGALASFHALVEFPLLVLFLLDRVTASSATLATDA